MHVVMAADAIHQPLTGIGRYAFELSRELRGIAEIDKLEFFSYGVWKDWPSIEHIANSPVVLNPRANEEAKKAHTLRSILAGNIAALRLFEIISPQFFRYRLQGHKEAIFHSPNYFLPPHSGFSISTIHDLSHEVHPKFHPKNRVDFMRRVLPASLKRADYLITASNSVRDEVIAAFNWPQDRVFTTLLGVRNIYHPRSENEIINTLRKHDLLSGGYTLFVGTLEPRKNLIGLIDAYSKLPDIERKQFPLVLIGAIGWDAEPILKKITAAAKSGWLKYLQYVPQQELPMLYSGARLFAYPSFYEGFGLPPLEAMSSGVPVVTSNVSSMPEVAGGAALLVNPNDVESISDALVRGLLDEEWRHEAIARGLKRSQELTWSRCASATVDVYKKVSGTRR